MTNKEMSLLSKQAKAKGLIPLSVSERGTVLHALGLKLYTMQEIMDLHSLMIDDYLQVWPYDLCITYVDPELQVANVEIEYRNQMIKLSWWMDLQSIKEAGLAPLMIPNGKLVDMAFLCEEQGQEMYNAMFLKPVNGRWPELEHHVKYVFDTLYHVNHKVPRVGAHEEHWINSIEMAEVWMEHFIKLGYVKLEKVLDTERYQQWCDSMVWIEANKQVLVEKHKEKESMERVKRLAAKL
jgi:hypothetical protein